MQHLHLCRLRQWRGEGQKRLASQQSNEHTKFNPPLPELLQSATCDNAHQRTSIACCYNYPSAPFFIQLDN